MSNLVTPDGTDATPEARPSAMGWAVPVVITACVVLALWMFGGGPASQERPDTGTSGPLADPPDVTTTTVTVAPPTEASSSIEPTRPDLPLAGAPGGAPLEGWPELTTVAIFGSAEQLVAGETGVLWWRAGWGLGRVDPASAPEPTFYLPEDDPFFGGIRAIAPALDATVQDVGDDAPFHPGGVWAVGADGTLRRFDGERFVEVIEAPEPLCQVAESPSLGVWAVGCGWAASFPIGVDEQAPPTGDHRGWLYRWTGDRWEVEPPGRPEPGAGHLTVDSGGDVWVSNCPVWRGICTGGVSVYDGVGWTTFTAVDGLPPGAVGMISAGVPGEVWVDGSQPQGPSVYDGTGWDSEPLGSQDEWNRWRGLTSVVGVGGEWTATSSLARPHLLHKGDDGWSETSMAGTMTEVVAVNGEPWVGVDGVLHRVESGEMVPFTSMVPPAFSDAPVPPAPGSWQITALAPDEALLLAEGEAWRCTAGGSCRPWSSDAPVDELVDVIVDLEGRVLALGDGRILVLEDGTWIPLTSPDVWEELHGS